MSQEIPISFSGNTTTDPELRFTPAGAAVVTVTVAVNHTAWDKQQNQRVDQGVTFLTCQAWREQAENIAETITKGQRVNVRGWLKSRSYETRDGEKRTVFEVEVDELSPSLRWAVAKVERRGQQAGGSGQGAGWGSGQRTGQGGWGQQGASAGGADPWADQSGRNDEPPF